uniref:Uncharacterized protein n=1 Tax=viral metagenome TaxID=1070528 RepID=A0A6C0F3Y9_9ZZZZ
MPKKTAAQKRKIRRMMNWSRRKEDQESPHFRTKNRGTRKKFNLGYQSDESSPRSSSSKDDLQVSSSTGSSVASILETIFPFSKSQTQIKKSSLANVSSGRHSRSSKSSSTNSIWRTVSSVLGLDEK